MAHQIHPTACVDPSVQLGEDVVIGPYTIVEAGARIGDRTEIAANVTIGENTLIGSDNEICRGAIIGGKPQDIGYKGEKSNVIIGSGNRIREYATIHKATGEGKSTIVGDNNFIMSFVHLAHNVRLGNNIVLVNMVQLAGHVVVEDNATLGGMVAVPQFLRIGKLAMIGGYSRLFQDVPPFMLAEGNPAEVYSINKVGLRRNPQLVPPEVVPVLKEAYKIMYRQDKNISQAAEAIRAQCRVNDELPEQIIHLLDFLQTSKKGISHSAQKPRELLQHEDSGLPETLPFFEKMMRAALGRKLGRK